MKPARVQRPEVECLPNVPGVHWFAPDEDLDDEVVLSGEAGARIATLAEELRHVDRFLRARIDPPTRMIFSGPTGTGKTLVARWLGWRLKLPVAVADISNTADIYVNSTGKNLGDIFDGVVSVKSILFLDEIDGLCASRGDAGGAQGQQLAQATTVLLQKLDWLEPARIVIAATNHIELVDPALRRRLSEQLAFEPPTIEARRKMLEHWLGSAPVPSEVLDELAKTTEGLGGAELRARAMALGRRAIMAAPPPPPSAQRAISGAPAIPGAPSREDLARGAQQVLRELEAFGKAGGA